MIIHRYISFFTVVCVMQCMSQTLHGIYDGRADTWSVLTVYGGGYVQNVVMAPSDTNVWYAYVDVGGPYRSDDAGKHWRALHGGFSIDDRERNADHVRSLSVDPQNAIWYLLVLSSDGVGFQWRQETFRFAVVH